MLTPTKPSLQIVIAALNEGEGIGSTLAELRQYLSQPKIDGGSIDRTVVVAEEYGAEIIHQTGKGKDDAFAQGIKNIPEDVDYVVVTDADFTYPADVIPQMIRIL